MTGRPRSSGRSRCSTAAKNASRSTWRIVRWVTLGIIDPLWKPPPSTVPDRRVSSRSASGLVAGAVVAWFAAADRVWSSSGRSCSPCPAGSSSGASPRTCRRRGRRRRRSSPASTCRRTSSTSSRASIGLRPAGRARLGASSWSSARSCSRGSATRGWRRSTGPTRAGDRGLAPRPTRPTWLVAAVVAPARRGSSCSRNGWRETPRRLDLRRLELERPAGPRRDRVEHRPWQLPARGALLRRRAPDLPLVRRLPRRDRVERERASTSSRVYFATSALFAGVMALVSGRWRCG